uniref:Uncharacterized protein n=1 Tax=Arundo donax TaxID=35708 RepID=A0A0A9F801_ARUDO
MTHDICYWINGYISLDDQSVYANIVICHSVRTQYHFLLYCPANFVSMQVYSISNQCGYCVHF